LPRDAADDAGWDLRAVGEWLVVYGRELRDNVTSLARGYAHLPVVGTEVARHGRRMPCLVETGLVEADGEGLDQLGGLGLHERDDRRRIDASRKKCADRNV